MHQYKGTHTCMCIRTMYSTVMHMYILPSSAQAQSGSSGEGHNDEPQEPVVQSEEPEQ